MTGVDDLVRQVSYVFMMTMLPSALLGLFPFWLALRRRRPIASAAALTTCAILGFLAVIATGQRTYDPFVLVAIGASAGLLGAIAWSALLLRRPV